MKPITEKQLKAIEKLARITNTRVNNVEEMSSLEASRVISALIDKTKGNRSNNFWRKEASDYRSDALAGLAVKILAQRCKEDEMIGEAEKFKQRAVELYKVFESARQACLA